jgi:signal transduction histidine kinase
MVSPVQPPDELLALAPRELPNQRPTRFDGTGFEVPLDRFAAADRTILGRIYETVQGLPVLSRSVGPRDPAVKAYIRSVGEGGLLAEAQRLGVATREAGREDPAVRKAVHDIRGGGLTMLLGAAGVMDLVGADLIPQCIDAARDHAKIMRNLLPDIDQPVRAADEAEKPHGISHFVEKWQGVTVPREGGPVSIRVHCSYGGDISARCLETSSIDRVLYNYINNAIRFAASREVSVWVFPVGSNLVRWVVRNAIADDQVAFLEQATPELKKLYEGGVTRGGTGVGLANCAEIVAACFGVTPARAVTKGYLGARVLGKDYVAWFHWPAVTTA